MSRWPPGVMGYVDRPSAAPGETVLVHVSTDAANLWTADLVQLLSADLAPEGPPFAERLVPDVAAVSYQAIAQPVPVGSYARADGHLRYSMRSGIAVSVEVQPTLSYEPRQCIFSNGTPERGAGLAVYQESDNTFCVSVATTIGRVSLSPRLPFTIGCWYRLAIVVDPVAGELRMTQSPIGTRAANRVGVRPEQDRAVTVSAALPGLPVGAPPEAPVLLAAGAIGADGVPSDCFTGRIGPVTVLDGVFDPAHSALTDVIGDTPHPRLVAHWDPALDITPSGIQRPSRLSDAGPLRQHATVVNRPLRAVTGAAWDGAEHDFRRAPRQYAAVHFHRDDLSDCAWTPQWTLRLPDDLASGIYAIRVRAGEHTDRIPFVVRPPRVTTRRAAALLVLPTNSYLAYANDHVATDSPRVQMLMRRVPQLDDLEVYRHAHREFGSSLYEIHADGSPIALSSWRRPILTMRPHVRLFNARAWQFTGDLQLIDWLERTGRRVDIVSDVDVHREGRALLDSYACVLTGTHPEYVSGAMLDAFSDYVAGGGRLMYLGGNGFYWVTGHDPEDDQIIEIRRWGGTEAWTAAPGEYHLASTGELGGIWRNRGRPPQKLTGVGFIAQGLDAASGYRRRADADPRTAWVLAGVDPEVFGVNGTLGGAAGMEIDAVDGMLGTPDQAVVIATSEGHSDHMLLAREAMGMTLPHTGGARNPRVHADMVLVPWPGGGGVFAPGSISWAASLAADDYAGPVSRIMANVLDRFCSDAPLLDDPTP